MGCSEKAVQDHKVVVIDYNDVTHGTGGTGGQRNAATCAATLCHNNVLIEYLQHCTHRSYFS